MQHDLADAPCSQLREDRIEALAAVAESLGIGAIAERDDAVLHAGEIRTRAPHGFVEVFCVVGHVALPVSGRADQKQATARKYPCIEAVHRTHLHAGLAIVERELELLRDQLGGAGHRPDEDSQR